MTGYSIDSSALVKRHLLETGTGWVRRITRRNPSTAVYIARVTTVEVVSAIARRRKGGSLSPTRASSVIRRFRHHLAARYIILEMTPDIANEAMRLGNAHVLRAYDAVQLASALEVDRSRQADGFGPITLVSADQALNDAATLEGMAVDDPNLHP